MSKPHSGKSVEINSRYDQSLQGIDGESAMGSVDNTEGLITPLVDAHVNLDDSSTKE